MTIDDYTTSPPDWLVNHRLTRPYSRFDLPHASRLASAVEVSRVADQVDPLEHVKTAFNDHAKNTGAHVSPYDTGKVQIGVDGLEVRLLQGIDMERLKQVVVAGKMATIGRPRPLGPGPMSDQIALTAEDWQEMFRGGLQAALESQTIVFEVWGASRILTHQLVRSRRAGFHQQSQRSTWYGDRPEVRMPETVWRAGEDVRLAWVDAYTRSWAAYKAACDAGVPYEDARYILPEGTVNYITCEYTIREFIAVFAYRGCSMFLREMVHVMREMRALVLEQCPELKPFIKISCETKTCINCLGSGMLHRDGVPATLEERAAWLRAQNERGMPAYELEDCPRCNGTGGRKCTFQGWENVELACDFPWAKESNRTFLATPRLRIGAS